MKNLPKNIIQKIGEDKELWNCLYVIHDIWVLFPREAGVCVEPGNPYRKNNDLLFRFRNSYLPLRLRT